MIIIFIIFVSFSSYNAIFNNDSSTNSKNNSVSNSQNDQFIAQEISNNIAKKDQPLVFEEAFYEENKANIENEASNLMVDNKLRLNFFDQCWIEIYSRNELIANQLFQQGDVYILDIKKPFKVVVGDADNVEGTYNGDSIDFITNANRLRVNTITFNDE